MTSATALPDRACAGCTLCCRLPEIETFDKPANAWCSHCQPGSGCVIYDTRPALCRDFLCLWRTSGALGPEWNPIKAGMMVYVQGPQTTVLVDPAFPDAWKREPFAAQLRQWATDVETDGGYVVVFVGDDVFKIQGLPQAARPDRSSASCAT